MQRSQLTLKKGALIVALFVALIGAKWLLPPIQQALSSILLPTAATFSAKEPAAFVQKAKELELQNAQLKEKLQLYEQLIEQDCHLIAKMATQFGFEEEEVEQKRLWHLARVMNALLPATPARVIYRSSEAWTHTLWIDIGEEHNRQAETQLIGKNSPVVWGSSLVGVVEYVGKRQSRVRLITDSALTPSVRILREESGSERLAEQAQALVSAITLKSELFSSSEEKADTIATLVNLKKRLGEGPKAQFLAKGEIRGSGAPLWRSDANTLYASGLHYDFADEEGPARDLRTGQEAESYTQEEIPLVQEGDVLVTTGYDGVFPKGLFVGVVEKVFPLEEGDYSYRLIAKPCAETIGELPLLFVLPPQPYDPKEQPPAYPWL